MFGYRLLGRLEDALLTCAAEAPDGTVYVGCTGPRPQYWTPSLGRWASDYAPGLFTLEDEVFSPVDGFDADDRWVSGMLPDETGVWLAGGVLGEGAAVWRIEEGDVVHEVIAAAGSNVAELVWLDGKLYALGQAIYRLDELALTQVSTPELEPASSLAALGDRLYWTTHTGRTAWMQGDYQTSTESNTLQAVRGAHAVYQGRLWALQSADLGHRSTHDDFATQGARIMPALSDDDPMQALAWCDGWEWRTVAQWHVGESGMYERLAVIGARLWLFGELWTLEGQDHADAPCTGVYDGNTLALADPWPYWVERIVAGGRRAVMVGDDAPYGRALVTVDPGSGGAYWVGPSVVLAASLDPAIHEIRVEVGDGTGETPHIHELRIEVGDGTGLTPHIHEVRVEFAEAARGPDGELVLWLVSDEGGPCLGLRVTTGATWETDVQVRGLVRCDKEALDVDDWGSYQRFALNEQVTVEEPGTEVRIGLIVDDGYEGVVDVEAQLLREDA